MNEIFKIYNERGGLSGVIISPVEYAELCRYREKYGPLVEPPKLDIDYLIGTKDWADVLKYLQELYGDKFPATDQPSLPEIQFTRKLKASAVADPAINKIHLANGVGIMTLENIYTELERSRWKIYEAVNSSRTR